MNASKSPSLHTLRYLVIGIVAAALLLSGFSVLAASRQQDNNPVSSSQVAQSASASGKISAFAFQNAMRKLWEEHVTWTRLYIISAAADLPDKDATAQRLLQNQADIGNAVKAFYGNAAGDQLTALLREHILLAASLIADVKSGDTLKATADSKAWYANADQIATFLSSANPKNWPLVTMKAQMKMHLDLTLAEAGDRLNGKYEADIKDYDLIENHILAMADVLSSGILKQFPSQFTR